MTEEEKLAEAVAGMLEDEYLDRKLSGSIMALVVCAAAAIVDLVIFVHLVFDGGGLWVTLFVAFLFVFMCWQASLYLTKALRARREICRKDMVRREMGRSPEGSGGKGSAWDAEDVSLEKGSRI